MSQVLECAACGRRTFYEKHRCRNCGSSTFQPSDPGTGTVQAVTSVHVTPEDVSEPNRLGLASFPGGASIIARIDEALESGDPVSITEVESTPESRSTVKLVPPSRQE